MTPSGERPARRSRRAFGLMLTATLLTAAGFGWLGVWQVHRRVWKLDLIAQMDARLHAPPVDAPGPAAWPAITAADAYRRVRAHGVFLNDREVEVQAVTALGGGYWVVTPLVTDWGFTVLVNRGFVPQDQRDPATRPAGQIRGATEVTGLLRVTEPGGGFLQSNDPGADRWYSRDVAAIAQARGLADVAPYFIDAAATPSGPGAPVGGLTVTDLPNNHLVYAITWFSLAGLSLGGAGVTIRDARRGG